MLGRTTQVIAWPKVIGPAAGVLTAGGPGLQISSGLAPKGSSLTQVCNPTRETATS